MEALPHSTIVSLPVLSPAGEGVPEAHVARLDADDAVERVVPPPETMGVEEAKSEGVQPTHVLPPRDR